MTLSEGRILLTAILGALSRHHLYGIGPRIGRNSFQVNRLITIQLQPPPVMEVLLVSWGYDVADLDMLVDTFEGKI